MIIFKKCNGAFNSAKIYQLLLPEEEIKFGAAAPSHHAAGVVIFFEKVLRVSFGGKKVGGWAELEQIQMLLERFTFSARRGYNLS